MSENASSKCPQCGDALPGGLAALACPRCAAGFLGTAPTEMPGEAKDSPQRFTPPPLSELAPLFPQLEILELLGHGGMGAVYKARQKELDRIVALKILPPGIGGAAFADRFAREAKAMARLNHPGIVAIYEFGRSSDLFFLLMEFVDGVTLGHVLKGERISAREALAIVPEICDALQYAHDQGIVHRDIKPENILLDRRGRTKVADFGLAKLMESDEPTGDFETGGVAGSPGISHSSKVLGTPQYMAPEQFDNPTAVDHRADIYALGVVFYQMLTGELPGRRMERPSKKVRIDVRLDEVVLRALEQNPDRRYAHASALGSEVETIALTEARSADAFPSASHSSVREDGIFWKLARALTAQGSEPHEQTAHIRAFERDTVLPIRLFMIGLLGYYFYFSGFFGISIAKTITGNWGFHNIQILLGIFVTYVALTAFTGVILVRAKNLSLVKIQWLVFPIGILDALIMAALTALTGGFDSNLYWVFPALILHNALSVPGVIPQLLLNSIVGLAFMVGGLLEQSRFFWTADNPILESSPSGRLVVLVAWALCCYGVQALSKKQRQLANGGDRFAPRPGPSTPKSTPMPTFDPANRLLGVALLNLLIILVYSVNVPIAIGVGHSLGEKLRYLGDMVYGPLKPLATLATLVSVLGAWRMRTYRDLRLGKVAVAICMIFPPGLVFGLPIGIALLRRLKSPFIQNAFSVRAKIRQSGIWEGDPLAPLLALIGMPITGCMAWLLFIIAWISPGDWRLAPNSGTGDGFHILLTFLLPLFFIGAFSPIAGWLAWDGVGYARQKEGVIRKAVMVATFLPLVNIIGIFLGTYGTGRTSTLKDFFPSQRIASVSSILICFGIAWFLAIQAEKHRTQLFANGARLRQWLGLTTPFLIIFYSALVTWVFVPGATVSFNNPATPPVDQAVASRNASEQINLQNSKNAPKPATSRQNQTSGQTAPLSYQWVFNGFSNTFRATNASQK